MKFTDNSLIIRLIKLMNYEASLNLSLSLSLSLLNYSYLVLSYTMSFSNVKFLLFVLKKKIS